jgi:hypothetical protein
MGRRDADELLEAWQDEHKVHHFECSTKNLRRLLDIIGYESIDEFLSDNSGAQAAIVEFIAEWVPRIPEWEEGLRGDLLASDDEEDEDDYCPGCGAVPGDGLTASCEDSLGCGYWRKEHLSLDGNREPVEPQAEVESVTTTRDLK